MTGQEIAEAIGLVMMGSCAAGLVALIGFLIYDAYKTVVRK